MSKKNDEKYFINDEKPQIIKEKQAMAVMSRTFNDVDLSDPKKAADYVKKKALEFGADAVGIGNIERWSNASTR